MQKTLLSVGSINKSFYGVRVLNDISFDTYEGEVIGLLGANGAGKSTLLKIISGTQTADSGSISLAGETIGHNSPEAALKLGIVSVYQELNLFSHLTIAENLFIGREIRNKFGIINWRQTYRQAQTILDSFGLDLRADALVSSLSVAQQHLVEIARAFNEKPKLLLLDEPTSALSENEIEWLFAKIREAAENGTTVVYVSHRLDEVTEICGRNVILRDGCLVHVSDGPMDKASMIVNIAGHDVVLKKALLGKNTSEVVLECGSIKSENGVTDAGFTVKKGEILGIAGLIGSGRTELLRTLFGIDKMISGTIKKNGKAISVKSPADAIKNGIILIPEDRKLEGLFLEEATQFNIAASTLDNRSRHGLVDRAIEKKAAEEASVKVTLDTGRLGSFVKNLSGGNQQKVVIAKTLLANSDVLLLDEPTRGVDIGAREEIYEIIKGFADSGKSIVLVSSDWEELIYLSHRIVVMSEMRVTGEIEENISEAEILRMTDITVEKKEEKKEARKGLKALAHNFFASYKKNNFMLLLILLLVLLGVGSALSPFFRTWMNFSNLFGQSMMLTILALGQLIVIIAGGIDLSSGSLMAASGVIGLKLMTVYPDNPILGVAVMLAFGCLVGFTNASLVLKAKVNSFVVTIGMMLVLEGVTLIVSPKPFGPAPQIFKTLFNEDFFAIPAALILLLILLAVYVLLLRYTTLGRGFYAVGESKGNAFNAGFKVNKIIYLSYIFCSLMSVLAAMFVLGRSGAADPDLGPGLELEAIACVLIGGATLAGGRGSIIGTVCGVFVLNILANVLSMMDIDLWYQEVIRGVMLLTIIISYEKMTRKKIEI